MNAKRTAPKAVEGEQQPSFEDAMKRLEKLVDEMEGGELSLEAMIARFEEGQKLIGFCTKKLNEVEKKVELLVRKGGKTVAEPFDESAGADDEPEPEDDDDDAEEGEEELF